MKNEQILQILECIIKYAAECELVPNPEQQICQLEK